MNDSLRNKLIRLAYTKPEIRKDILLLLNRTNARRRPKDQIKTAGGHELFVEEFNRDMSRSEIDDLRGNLFRQLPTTFQKAIAGPLNHNLSKTEREVLNKLDDVTEMEFVSSPLLHSKAFRAWKAPQKAALISLIRKGHLRLYAGLSTEASPFFPDKTYKLVKV